MIMEKEKIIARAAELIAQCANAGSGNYCALIFMDPDGSPVATTISISKSQGLQWLTFCTGMGAHAPTQLAQCPKASVCLNSPEYHICLTGTAELLTDLETRREMWYEGLCNHFTGPEDPNLCVIKFTPHRYSLFVDWEQARGEL